MTYRFGLGLARSKADRALVVNANYQTLGAYRAAVAAVRANSARAKLAFIGTSIVVGNGAGTGTNGHNGAGPPGASEPSAYAFTGAGDDFTVILARITGADPTDPIEASAKYKELGGTPDNIDFPSVTTGVDDCLGLLLGGIFYALTPSGSDWPNAAPSGATMISAKDADVSNTGTVGGIAYFTQSSAGATGVKSVPVPYGFGTQWYAVTLAIKAATGGDPGPIDEFESATRSMVEQWPEASDMVWVEGSLASEVINYEFFNPPASPGGYSLSAATGSFSLSSQEVAVKRNLNLDASATAFSLTGLDVGLTKKFNLSSETGSFSLTGQAVNLLKSSRLFSESGNFYFTGISVDLIRSISLVSEPGIFTLLGVDANFSRDKSISANVGQFNFQGQDAILKIDRRLLADPGVYSLVGQDVAFRLQRIISAAPGSFLLDGKSAGLSTERRLITESGSYLLGSPEIAFTRTRSLFSESGYFYLSGLNNSLKVSKIISAEIGNFSVTGVPADLLVDRKLSIETGEFNLLGIDVDLTYNRSIQVETGVFYLLGLDAVLFKVGLDTISIILESKYVGDIVYQTSLPRQIIQITSYPQI